MKTGDEEITAQGIPPGMSPGRGRVQLVARAFGFAVLARTWTPEQARQLARELDAAADQAEGRGL